MVASKVDEHGLFLFYYSGHGGKLGKLTIGGEGRVFNVDNLLAEFEGIKGNRLCILDCCFARNFRVIGGLNNCAFMGSSQEDEAAYERVKEGGIYTQALVRALRHALSKNNNYVRVGELRVTDFKTEYHVAEGQEFTMFGSLSFTVRPASPRT
ncbi:caspase family protein [Candidatus Woesearchaeota archaeon]|nr:caspase family protein [Candidatus Woesearchaeota archaeon]